MKPTPLDDLEMHEVLRLCYPDHIRSDDDEYFALSQEVCAEATVDLGDGFAVKLSDLLARVVMLTSPLVSSLSGRMSHCLGAVTVNGAEVDMVVAVRRDVAVAKDGK